MASLPSFEDDPMEIAAHLYRDTVVNISGINRVPMYRMQDYYRGQPIEH